MNAQHSKDVHTDALVYTVQIGILLKSQQNTHVQL